MIIELGPNHLGINLYSNMPSVLSEVVANSWDADAENVHITVDAEKIIIKDDGFGMNADDFNDKYLRVSKKGKLMISRKLPGIKDQ